MVISSRPSALDSQRFYLHSRNHADFVFNNSSLEEIMDGGKTLGLVRDILRSGGISPVSTSYDGEIDEESASVFYRRSIRFAHSSFPRGRIPRSLIPFRTVGHVYEVIVSSPKRADQYLSVILEGPFLSEMSRRLRQAGFTPNSPPEVFRQPSLPYDPKDNLTTPRRLWLTSLPEYDGQELGLPSMKWSQRKKV